MVKLFFLHAAFFLLGLAVLPIAGCTHDLGDALQSGRTFGVFGLDGRWAGLVSPATEDCGQPATGLMTVSGRSFAFDPFQSTFIINGTIDQKDELQGAATRGSAGNSRMSIAFTATTRLDAGKMEITGTLVSGRCRWKVSLNRR